MPQLKIPMTQLRHGTAKQINTKRKKKKRKKDGEDSCASGNPEVLVTFTRTRVQAHALSYAPKLPCSRISNVTHKSVPAAVPRSPILGWSAPQQSVWGDTWGQGMSRGPMRGLGHCPCCPATLSPPPPCPLRTHLQGDTVVWSCCSMKTSMMRSQPGTAGGGVKK